MTFSKKIHNCIQDMVKIWTSLHCTGEFSINWEICLLVVKYLRARCMLKSQLIWSDLVIPKVIKTCAAPGIFVRGGPGWTARKNCLDNVFWVFFSPQFILQSTEGVQWVYYGENYTFLRILRGFNIFQGGGGVQLFPGGGGGGVQILISIKTHITCEFPGGSGPPIPPLDPHLKNVPSNIS